MDFKMKLKMAIDPYYSWKQPVVVTDNKKMIKSEKVEFEAQANEKLVAMKKNPMTVITQSQPFLRVDALDFLPADGEIWYYHDKKATAVFAKINAGELARLDGKGFRNTKDRKNLKADIYPAYWASNNNQNKGLPREKWVHATHLLPFGLHGQEGDSRLLVQWLGKQNTNEMNAFEQEVKKIPFSIYWMTVILRTSEGAKWYYKIYRAEDMKLIKKLELAWDTELVWN